MKPLRNYNCNVGGAAQVLQNFTRSQELLPGEPLLPHSQHQRGTVALRQAADRCKLNYSTAKIILRDLTPKEHRFVRRLIRRKENDEKFGMNVQAVCQYMSIEQEDTRGEGQVQVVSRVAYDFFAVEDKKK